MHPHVYPGATYRPVAWAEARDDDTNPTCVILHVSAGESPSLYDFFNRSRTACSNAHVARNGHIEQYIRGDRLSAADYQGSGRAFSIETQGADADGRWTAAQLESLARLCAWAHQTYGIPLETMGSSAYNEFGIGWHRLGIVGNFPPTPSLLAGRRQIGFGELWSSHFGKVCPGDNRILQIPGIVKRAREIASSSMPPFGQGPGTGPLLPTAPPTPSRRKYSMRRLDLRSARKKSVRGADVKKLQGLLLAHGYGPSGLTTGKGAPDGIAGTYTRLYVGRFQVKHNVGDGKGNADYIVGDATWTALIEK